jgi:hypothetical protein
VERSSGAARLVCDGRVRLDSGWSGAVSKKLPAPIPRLALTPSEAAAAIGVGEDFFTEHVRPELQLIRRGRKVLVPVAELERWMGANAERPWGSAQRRPGRLARPSVARR